MLEITTEIGMLSRVNVRELWQHEASSFTPWLAENIDLLSDAIGIPLEVQAQEQAIGMFRADILAKNTLTGAWVLIENQIERTDHGHLGQLITYASGLQAVTIVWIASAFTEEHRAALDWLNEITSEQVTFFGLEIELWRIEESPVAPKLNVVCKPNNWKRAIAVQALSDNLKRDQIQAILEEKPETTVSELVNLTGVSKGYASKQRTRLLHSTSRSYLSFDIASQRYGYSVSYLTKLVQTGKVKTHRSDKTRLLESSLQAYVTKSGRKTLELPVVKVG